MTTGHAGTTHHLVRLAPLPHPAGIAWCRLCLKQVWQCRRPAADPRPSYRARPKKPAPAGPPPLAAKVAAARKAAAAVPRATFAAFHDVKGCA